MAVGLLGGVFDPPHNGHVTLARAAIEELGLERLLVLVVADPGHKRTSTPGEIRLELAQIAFEDVPGASVELDRHARTVDSLEERHVEDAVFVLGADELVGFESWKSPQRVLELVKLAVALRPGVSRGEVRSVRERLAAPGRILAFEVEPVDVSSSEIRARVAGGEPFSDLVPHAVADAIARLGLYRSGE